MGSPQFILIAGANGSGKSTSAPALVPATVPFINADDIARSLQEDSSGDKNILAGRLLLEEWDRLEQRRACFASETTLASRSLAHRIVRLRAAGYTFHLVFFYLENVELSIARVAQRVRMGGHDIPEGTIRRRRVAGLQNLFSLYMPLADTWHIFDNTRIADVRLIASGANGQTMSVYEPDVWRQIVEAVQR